MLISGDGNSATLEPSWLSETNFSDYSIKKRNSLPYYKEQTLVDKLYPNDADFFQHRYDELVQNNIRATSETTLQLGLVPEIKDLTNRCQIVNSKYNFDSNRYHDNLTKYTCRNSTDQNQRSCIKSSFPEFSNSDGSKKKSESSTRFNFPSERPEITKLGSTPFMVGPNNRNWDITFTGEMSDKILRSKLNPWARGFNQKPRHQQYEKPSHGNRNYVSASKNFGRIPSDSKLNKRVGDFNHVKTRFVQEKPSNVFFNGSSREHSGTSCTWSENVMVGLKGSLKDPNAALEASKCKGYSMRKYEKNKKKTSRSDYSSLSIMDRWLKSRSEQIKREREQFALSLSLRAVE